MRLPMWIPAIVLPLLATACSTSRPLALDDTVPSPSDMHLIPPLRLTQAWDNRPVNLPAPALWPDAPRSSPDYKRWLVIGNVTQFRYVDPADGHTYVANAPCLCRDAKGQAHAFISQVTDYRPDGTRARETLFWSAGSPAQWIIYGPDGQSPVVKVHTQPRPDASSPDGPVYVEYFYTHSPDAHRLYECTPTGKIVTECPVDAMEDWIGNALHTTRVAAR